MTQNEIVKTATEIMRGFNEMLLLGEIALKKGMADFRDIDSRTCEVNDKDNYIQTANSIGLLFFRQETGFQFQMAERFYLHLFSLITDYEKQNACHFNKGLVLANIGVSKIVQGEIESGVAHLFRAFKEDERFLGGPEQAIKNFFDRPLFRQFEDKEKKFFVGCLVRSGISPSSGDINAMWDSFTFERRFFFYGHVRRLRLAISLYKDDFEDSHTQGAILNSLFNLCIFIEDGLKRKSNNNSQLNPLLKEFALSLSAERKDFEKLKKGASSAVEFDDNLKEILSEPKQNIRMYASVGLLRNFGAHNIDFSMPHFFKHLDTVCDLVIMSIWCLSSSGKI